MLSAPSVERLRAERRMQERQRIEGPGLLAGGVAHDINNVLTCVLSSVALARRSADDPAELAALLDEIDHAAGRVADLCRQMLAYAGKGPLLRELVDLTRLVTTSLPLLRATLPPTATLDLRLAPSLPPILGDETQLRQIALNLVANAGDAVRGRGGVIGVSLRSSRVTRGSPEAAGLDVELPEGPVVVLGVADDGLGMPPEVVARIFEPFFTTKTVGPASASPPRSASYTPTRPAFASRAPTSGPRRGGLPCSKSSNRIQRTRPAGSLRRFGPNSAS